MALGRYNMRNLVYSALSTTVIYEFDQSIDLPGRTRIGKYRREVTCSINEHIEDVLQDGSYLKGFTDEDKLHILLIHQPDKPVIEIHAPFRIAGAHFFGRKSICAFVKGVKHIYQYNEKQHRYDCIGPVHEFNTVNFECDANSQLLPEFTLANKPHANTLHVSITIKQNIQKAHGRFFFFQEYGQSCMYKYDEQVGTQKFMDIRDIIKYAELEYSGFASINFSVSTDLAYVVIHILDSVRYGRQISRIFAKLVATQNGEYTIDTSPPVYSNVSKCTIKHSPEISFVDDNIHLFGTRCRDYLFRNDDAYILLEKLSADGAVSSNKPQRHVFLYRRYLSPEYDKMQWIALYKKYKGRKVDDDLFSRIFSLPPELAQLIFSFVTGVDEFVSDEVIN